MSSKKTDLSQTAKHDLKAYDLFQLTPYFYAGEPYEPEKTATTRDPVSKKKQIYTNPHKTGLMNESTFGPFLSLATSEPYQPPQEFKRYESHLKPVSTKPFRPASPTKKLTGPGDTHGCFNPIEYISENSPTFSKTGGSTKHASSRSFGTTQDFGATGSSTGSTSRHSQKQFVQPPFRPASPNKTGVLGTLAPFPEYISNNSDTAGTPRDKIKEKEKVPRVPFRAMSPPLRGWDMSVYQPTTSPKHSRPKTVHSSRKEFVQPPFRPASPNKKGVLGTLAPFPAYIPGTDLKKDAKPVRARTASSASRQPIFYPTGAIATTNPQPSILAMAATRSMH